MIVVRLATSATSPDTMGSVSPAALELSATESVDITWLMPVASL
ncbi:MAG: hypothetical protein JWQ43_299 [Glaciihabitans sp.]|nr:hypothetical protein [Glaciihabitans sp.]